MAPRRMDKVQLDVALPPAGGKKSNFFEMCSGYDKSYLIYTADLLDEERAMARTRQVRMRARQATANACLSSLLLLFIISYFGID